MVPLSLLPLLLVLSLLLSPSAAYDIRLDGKLLHVNGQPFEIRGLCYAPVPIGDWGHDVYTDNYAALWARDFPLMAAAGVNTLRVYEWAMGVDHSKFLAAAAAHGFAVLLTFPVPTAAAGSRAVQDGLVTQFVAEVLRTAHAPAVLGWSFGNELNGAWNGWCADDCVESLAPLFAFVERATAAAKAALAIAGAPAQLMILPVADSAQILAQLSLGERLAPSVDVWGPQLYRGRTMSAVLSHVGALRRPVIVMEFGVDAYYDACGWAADGALCRGTELAPGPTAEQEEQGVAVSAVKRADGSGEDEAMHADWLVALARELHALAAHGNSANSGVLGGCAMEWSDERWKNAGDNVLLCPDAAAADGSCPAHAHTGCPVHNVRARAVCGFPNPNYPDRYSNEAWYGLVVPVPVHGAIDAVRPRAAYYQLARVWTAAHVPPAPSWLPFWPPLSWGTQLLWWYAAFALMVLLAVTTASRFSTLPLPLADALRTCRRHVSWADTMAAASATEHVRAMARAKQQQPPPPSEATPLLLAYGSCAAAGGARCSRHSTGVHTHSYSTLKPAGAVALAETVPIADCRF